MQLLSGKTVSTAVLAQVKESTAGFIRKYGRAPSLAVILVGGDPASQTYVASKKKAAIALGFGHKDYQLPATTSQSDLLDIISGLNNDDSVDGILVQMPLPVHLDENCVIDTIAPEKDVDGFHPINAGKVLLGRPAMISCTPKGVLAILDYYQISTQGRNVVVLGRSSIVGKPMAALLMQRGRDATVTICHSRTPDIKKHTLQADILIAAVGRPCMVTADMVKEGAVVVDVGINRIEDSTKKNGWRLVGDVDYEGVAPHVSAITPVPGGVGPMTIAMLMENTLIAARRRKGENA